MDNSLLIEIRYAEDPDRQSPGRIVGTLVTYGARAADRPERFLQDALTWADDGILINEQHNRSAPIVRAIPFVQDNAVKIDAPLPNTQRGRDAATNIKERVLTGLSVEFAGAVASTVNGERHIRSARLTGGGLVDMASYSGSGVEIRHAEGPSNLAMVLPWL